MSVKKTMNITKVLKSKSKEEKYDYKLFEDESEDKLSLNTDDTTASDVTKRPQSSKNNEEVIKYEGALYRSGNVKREEQLATSFCGDDNTSDTVTLIPGVQPSEDESLAIPDSLGMDPLAPNAVVVSTDLMDRIGSGLTLFKDHGKKLQKYLWKNTKFDIMKKSWSSVVTVVLVEARDLPDCPPGGSNGVYCKCRLGTELHKSKLVPKNEQPAWRERFNLHLFEDNRLELTVWHKGKQKNFMGRCSIDLSTLERDRTHDLWLELECGFGAVHVLLTLSGAPRAAPADGIPTTYPNGAHHKPLPVDKYAWYNVNATRGGDAVGEVRVTVHGARGLPPSPLGARPLALAVLELDNARVQTHAARAAPDPHWNQTYTFEIMDITSTLEVSVCEESIISPLKGETLGKVSIPLLRINNGEKRWYALKDKSKRVSAKGNCPRILLEMHVVWNPIKASLRVLTPREAKYVQKPAKFDIPLIYNNLKFIRDTFNFLYELNECIKEAFEWDSTERCAITLAAWITLCYCFRLWMAPLAILAPFVYNWITRRVSCANNSLVPIEYTEQELEESNSDSEKDEKTFKNRINVLQDMTFTIKNGIDYIVSISERLKNLSNFTVPYLSLLAMIILIICSVALYLIPINYLFMALGIYKFTRKLLNPNRILNNDLLDFLSRVPDYEILKEWRELKVPEPNLTRIGSRRKPRS